jgi:hypothetical protein
MLIETFIQYYFVLSPGGNVVFVILNLTYRKPQAIFDGHNKGGLIYGGGLYMDDLLCWCNSDKQV